jgi:hypothetical protein
MAARSSEGGGFLARKRGHTSTSRRPRKVEARQKGCRRWTTKDDEEGGNAGASKKCLQSTRGPRVLPAHCVDVRHWANLCDGWRRWPRLRPASPPARPRHAASCHFAACRVLLSRIGIATARVAKPVSARLPPMFPSWYFLRSCSREADGPDGPPNCCSALLTLSLLGRLLRLYFQISSKPHSHPKQPTSTVLIHGRTVVMRSGNHLAHSATGVTRPGRL